MESKQSFYDLMHIPEDATQEEIRKAYLEHKQVVDAHIANATTEEELNIAKRVAEELERIYAVLSNEVSRKQYDEELRASRAADTSVVNKSVYDDDIFDDSFENDDNQNFDLAQFFVQTGSSKNNNKDRKRLGNKYKSAHTDLVTVENLGSTNGDSHKTYYTDADKANIVAARKNRNNTRNNTTSNNTSDIDIPNNNATRVLSVEDDEEASKTADKAKNTLKILGVAALAAAIILTTLGIGVLIGKGKNKNNDKQSGQNYIVTDATDSNTVTSTSQNDKPQNESPVVNPITNLGDATDPAVVEEKVNQLSDLVNSLGIINPQTREAYTKEELKEIVLFMNGAFIPEDEERAYSIVIDQIDLVCQFLSTDRVRNLVNYMGGDDSLTTNMNQDMENGKDLCLVDTMLLGDSYGYEYLKFLENSYNDLMNTSDRELFRTKHDKLVKSLAEVVYGRGYDLDGKNFTLADFSGIGDLNDGNLLMMYSNLISLFMRDEKEIITVVGRNGEDVSVTVEELFSNFSLDCDASSYNYNNEGRLISVEENFHQRTQVNSINAALENRYHGNLNAYDDTFNKSLRK